ncbi:hypothetical protein ACQCN2_13080 [Brevibacillus ginsengisoli]|uniref:hypothetical protein n=1 Tax=Brevibacillus ginsengisoli TaxID=363854 RepID=UPI003CED4774
MAGEYSKYDYVEANTVDIDQLEPLDFETDGIIKADLGTGLKLAFIYFAFILAMPVLNWFAGGFMFSRMWGGMTYAWFFTGIVAMLMAFLIAYINIHSYEKRLLKNANRTQAKENERRRIG